MLVYTVYQQYPGPVGAQVFLLKCCFVSKKMALGIEVKQLHFGLTCPQDIVPAVMWFIQM